MNLLVVGISHKKAPLELRERFALNERIIPEVLRRLQSEPEIEEAVILSTCNRVEFVLVAFEKQDAMAGFRRFAESFYGVRFDEFTHCFYVHHEEEAVRHLFQVAAGLDSLIVGEPQVLGQVKQAYFLAKEAETRARWSRFSIACSTPPNACAQKPTWRKLRSPSAPPPSS